MSETQTHKSETLEHLGLVAGMFDELGIGDLVDELVPQDLSQRNVSVGQALKAMVLNGLGFARGRLYLMPEFFLNKPTERLVGAGISPEHLNDDALGKALDTLYAFGLTELYRLIARRAAERLGLDSTVRMGHLDTTSFHVDGRYNSEGDDDEDFDEEGGLIRVSKGYSRDHRDDLNQVVLELITESQANLPMMMRPLSGNASDKTSFKDATSSDTSASCGAMRVPPDHGGPRQRRLHPRMPRGLPAPGSWMGHERALNRGRGSKAFGGCGPRKAAAPDGGIPLQRLLEDLCRGGAALVGDLLRTSGAQASRQTGGQTTP